MIINDFELYTFRTEIFSVEIPHNKARITDLPLILSPHALFPCPILAIPKDLLPNEQVESITIITGPILWDLIPIVPLSQSSWQRLVRPHKTANWFWIPCFCDPTSAYATPGLTSRRRVCPMNWKKKTLLLEFKGPSWNMNSSEQAFYFTRQNIKIEISANLLVTWVCHLPDSEHWTASIWKLLSHGHRLPLLGLTGRPSVRWKIRRINNSKIFSYKKLCLPLKTSVEKLVESQTWLEL